MTINKRQKEQVRRDRAKAKEEKREQRKNDRATRPRGESEEDPDLAGIVPGPQPQPLEND